MTIKYSKKYIRTDLLIGSLYLLSGGAGLIFQSGFYHLIINLCFFVAGFFFLGSCNYKQRYNYLKIEDQVLTCFIFGSKNKSVAFRELVRIKEFADEITMVTASDKLTISTNLMDIEDLNTFKEVMASLNLEPEKNPFTYITKN